MKELLLWSVECLQGRSGVTYSVLGRGCQTPSNTRLLSGLGPVGVHQVDTSENAAAADAAADPSGSSLPISIHV